MSSLEFRQSHSSSSGRSFLVTATGGVEPRKFFSASSPSSSTLPRERRVLDIHGDGPWNIREIKAVLRVRDEDYLETDSIVMDMEQHDFLRDNLPAEYAAHVGIPRGRYITALYGIPVAVIHRD